MLTPQQREEICQVTKRTTESNPILSRWALEVGPVAIYDALIRPANVPDHPDAQELAQAMRENREETIKLLAAILGMM